MRAHNIAWATSGAAFSDVYGGPWLTLPHIFGNLNDVTLAQALDYVLKTFPGFWAYENCQREDGTRVVFFEIFQTFPHRDRAATR